MKTSPKGARRRITDAIIENALRREHAGKDPLRKYDRKVRKPRPFCHMAGAVIQTKCTTAGFLRSCERFYAEIDRMLLEWERKRDLELGVRQAVLREKAERHHQKCLRKLIRDDLLRRGVV